MISVNAKIPSYLEKAALIYLRKAVEVKREPVQTPVDHSELSPALPCLLQPALKANPQVEKPSSKVKVGDGFLFPSLFTYMVWTFEGCWNQRGASRTAWAHQRESSQWSPQEDALWTEDRWCDETNTVLQGI